MYSAVRRGADWKASKYRIQVIQMGSRLYSSKRRTFNCNSVDSGRLFSPLFRAGPVSRTGRLMGSSAELHSLWLAAPLRRCHTSCQRRL